MKAPRRLLIKRALLSWRSLNEVITQLTEHELTLALQLERSNAHRTTLMRRLHQRLSVVRRARERRQLLR